MTSEATEWLTADDGRKYFVLTHTHQNKKYSFRVYESALAKGLDILEARAKSRLAALTAEEAHALADAAYDAAPTPELSADAHLGVMRRYRSAVDGR